MTKQILTTDVARAKFKNMQLSYDILDEPRIRLLYKMSKTELKNFQKKNTDKMHMKINNELNIKITSEGKFIQAFIYVDAGYFKQREAISFNKNGFIGFAGWTSSQNTQPFIKAFIKWCDILGELKDA